MRRMPLVTAARAMWQRAGRTSPRGILAILMFLAMGVPQHAAIAQSAAKALQIGYVGNSTPAAEAPLVEAFRRGLRERGWSEGRDVVIQFRWAEGVTDRISPIIAEFVNLKVNVIVTSGILPALAAKRATSAVPVVMSPAGDPVSMGVVASLARPGGNITGLSAQYTELEGKRLEILRDLVPRMQRVAVLTNPDNPFTRLTLKTALNAAELQKLRAQVYEVRAADEFDAAFAAMAKSRPDALAVLADRPFFFANRAQIVRLAALHRLPAIHPFPEFVDEGGLVFYGPSFVDIFHRAATYVDRILRGAKPGDLPIEQPTKFELLVNLKTAKAQGIRIPQEILFRANRVIE